MANTYIYNILDNWTDGNTQYKAISVSVTATNSHTNSYLFYAAYNNTAMFSVKKDGTATLSKVVVSSVSAPANSSANGTAGEVRWDSSYVYVCIATNTWKRSALSSW